MRNVAIPLQTPVNRAAPRAAWLRRSGAALFVFFAVKGLAWLAVAGFGGRFIMDAW